MQILRNPLLAYVCAEWDYGGIPVWLGFKEGIAFRAYNDVWMKYMQQWFVTVVDRLKPYFSVNGGPIVLVQVWRNRGQETNA